MFKNVPAVVCLAIKAGVNNALTLGGGALLLFCLTTISQASVPGDLDPSFDADGKVTSQISASDDEALAVAVQSDGKIVVAGYSGGKQGDFAVARYTSPGQLDTAFGTGGITTTNIGPSDIAFALAIQSDGKIVLGGFSDNAFALARYNSSGVLDTSFGNGGVVTTIIGKFSSVNALAIQSDGKIIAAGFTDTNGAEDFAAARYTSAGILDNTFGSSGIVVTDFGDSDHANDVKIQSDGKILVAGVNNGSTQNFAVARYDANGVLDTSFQGSGKVLTVTNGEAHKIAVQADGKIIAAGSGNDYYLVRYTTNGAVDPTFGTNGIVTTNVGGTPDSANGLVLDSAGNIIVAGSTLVDNDEDFVVVRYTPTGALDVSFDGSDGIVTTSFGTNSDISYAVAMQANGKIVLAGSTGDFGSKDFAVARYFGNSQPTAASVIIGGHITSPSGRQVSNVRLILLNTATSETRYALANPFGYYTFYDVPVGSYVLTPNHKTYTFSPSSRFLSLTGNLNNADFVTEQ